MSVPVNRKQPLRLLLASLGAGGPHFVRATGVVDDSIRPTSSCGSGCEAHFARLGQSVPRSPASSGGRQHRIRGTTLVVGTGAAVRPLTLCLSAQGPRCTDPTIAPAFDGLKISVSRRVTFIDRSLLRSSFLGPRSEGFNRRLSPPEFPQCPTVREVRALVAPSTEMSRMTIYLAGLLEGDGRRPPCR
jgi:hypothetical protein